MLYQLDFGKTWATFYVLGNLCLALVVSGWFYVIYRKHRYLLVKPSVLLLLFTHILFQWPSVIFASYYEAILPRPYAITFLINAYVYIGLFVSTLYFRNEAKATWERITVVSTSFDEHVWRKSLYILMAMIAVVALYYLSMVPLSKTGLYVILKTRDPFMASVARAESLKLLESQSLKYAFSIMSSAMAPIASTLSALLAFSCFRKRRYTRAVAALAVLVTIMVVVALPGARASSVFVLLSILFAIYIKRKLHVGVVSVVLPIVVILLPAVLLTIFRESKTVEATVLLEYFGEIAIRIFATPFKIGLWYANYAQSNEMFGIIGFPKLAALFGQKSFEMSNFMAHQYMMIPRDATTSAVAGYLFTYYSYLGLASLLPSLLALWLTDIAILVYKRLPTALLLPCVAAISVATLRFTLSDYTTVWLTHGFGFILIGSLILSRLAVKNVYQIGVVDNSCRVTS